MRSSTVGLIAAYLLLVITVLFFLGQLFFGIHHGEWLRIAGSIVVLVLVAALFIFDPDDSP